MSYRTFYRKYRSGNFDELVGQEHIVQTLTNAIEGDRTSQAYIFSGPRGTGKTSSARIFAKAVNTYKTEGQFKDLSSDLCRRISEGSCVDVIEIDAASNTGVDNIREINEKINFTPVEAHFKIYIIDEVHMLSMGAFNALLKTLEEPPERVIFILATTEPHKIPITIHSRCQHLQFRNLTLDEIKTQLLHIAKKESLTIDDNALTLLSRNAQGCMRDGVSLLDQVYSFKGESITYEDVLYILGATEEGQLITLTKEIVNKNTQAILKQLQIFFDSGTNPIQLIADLIENIKTLLYIKVESEDILNAPPSAELRALANAIDLSFIERWLNILAKTEMELRWFSKPQLLLQLRLIELSTQDDKKTHHKEYSKDQTHSPKNENITITKNTTKTENSSVPQQTSRPKIAKPVAQTETKIVNKNNIQATWNEVIQEIQKTHHALYAILKESQAELHDNRLNLKLKQTFQFFIEKLKEEKTKNIINEAIKRKFQKHMEFQIIDANNSKKEGPNSAESIKNQSTTTVSLNKKEDKDSISEKENPEKSGETINKIVELFEGSIV